MYFVINMDHGKMLQCGGCTSKRRQFTSDYFY